MEELRAAICSEAPVASSWYPSYADLCGSSCFSYDLERFDFTEAPGASSWMPAEYDAGNELVADSFMFGECCEHFDIDQGCVDTSQGLRVQGDATSSYSNRNAPPTHTSAIQTEFFDLLDRDTYLVLSQLVPAGADAAAG